MVTLSPTSHHSPAQFDWPLAYEAEERLGQFIGAFLGQNRFARTLAQRMRDETGTDFYEWVDHLTVGVEHVAGLRALGLTEEAVPAPDGATVFFHPRAMMPRVLVRAGGSREGVPSQLAIRPEVVVDFLARHDLASAVEGEFGARLRRAGVSDENGTRLEAIERLGWRGLVAPASGKDAVAPAAVVKARELFRARKRFFPADAEGVGHAFAVLDRVLALVPRDVACELFFAEERVYWEFRNRAGRVQKRRQDLLGLGWGNHDHHTFRCSRTWFPDLIEFLARLGLEKRERYYAGEEAGWGAQIMEAPAAGIVVFADVDLKPGEIDIDFATQRLPELPALRTVGLWCALHGDSFLQAGMHHLEARFDFVRLRDQLEAEGVNTMKPFSDFPFLKQAFTEGERWRVRPERIDALLQGGLITAPQAEGFRRDGALGSHLENLQRKGGFKGFNQKAVSAIIAATDPRKAQADHSA
ncbi:MAG: hypothetical protein JWM88_377 [Verrucomicrobia bacterium]|nr:hypothetical protein [Verrucomicrobiota bacterium]